MRSDGFDSSSKCVVRLGCARLSCLRFLSHLYSPSGHYDEPETLSYAIPLICSIGADVRQCFDLQDNHQKYNHLRNKTYSLHHRTIPFTTNTDRIIVSFDLMPEAASD